MTPQSSVSRIMALLAGLAVAGCNSYSTAPVATEPDLVGTRIAQSAEKASKALETISGIEQQRFPVAPPDDFSAMPPNMTQPITVRWTGPVEQIVQTLAQRAGLRYNTRGKPPSVPITVAIDVYQQPLVEVLRSIGLQAGRRADVNLDGQTGVIEIRYAAADTL